MKVISFFWTKQPVLLVLILGFTHLSTTCHCFSEVLLNRSRTRSDFWRRYLLMTLTVTNIRSFFAMTPWLSFSFGPPRGKVWVSLESVSSQKGAVFFFSSTIYISTYYVKTKEKQLHNQLHSAYRHVSIIVGQTWKKWETTEQISPKIDVGDGSMIVKFKSRTF